MPRFAPTYLRSAVLLTLLTYASSSSALELDPAFGPEHDRVTAQLIESVTGPTHREQYTSLSRETKATYLDSFWTAHNPLLHRYFFGHFLSKRHYTVSDAFFEQLDLFPKEFFTGFTPPDSSTVAAAEDLSRLLAAALPNDPVSACTRGYVLLESGRGTEAEPYFIQAVNLNDRYAEAHNGRGLVYLTQDKRQMEALYHFRDAIASDDTYPAALYNLAMCHLAMGSIDLDHRFGMVVERFPNHQDAHFKLGAAYEDLYDFKKAAGAYSNQLIANPEHRMAKARLARVNLEMSWTNKKHYDIPEVEELVERDRLRYLPLLAETYLAKNNYVMAERTYKRYFRLIANSLRQRYEDITPLLSPMQAQAYQNADQDEKKAKQIYFWLTNDPTPTTPVNERQLEHYRRVHYALQNFSLGQKPWDKRGEVYIRFGHPDHRSWSGNIIFETDPDVVKVKNRLNDRTFTIRHEIIPNDLRHGGEGLFPSRDLGEIRGLPVFPVPHTGSRFRDGASLDARWESWIYARIDGGIELSFVDYTGEGRFDFARYPTSSPNAHIWQELAPATVFARVTEEFPSYLDYDYGGAPLTVHLDQATFRGDRNRSTLEIYVGVERDELGLEMREHGIYGQFDQNIVVYTHDGDRVYRDSSRVLKQIETDEDKASGLVVALTSTELEPGPHIVGASVRDPGTGRIQVLLKDVEVGDYSEERFAISDIQVAGKLEESTRRDEFTKEDLSILPQPSRAFRPGDPVYLYYEVYGLLRDANGQTRYRVDYDIRGGAPDTATRLFGRIAKFLGREERENSVRISYQHEGLAASEPLYVALDLTAEGTGDIQVRVSVTDLKQLEEPVVSKHVNITIGE